jgi:hypothetical protein
MKERIIIIIIIIKQKWGEEERVEVTGRKARGKETTRKTKTRVDR